MVDKLYLSVAVSYRQWIGRVQGLNKINCYMWKICRSESWNPGSWQTGWQNLEKFATENCGPSVDLCFICWNKDYVDSDSGARSVRDDWEALRCAVSSTVIDDVINVCRRSVLLRWKSLTARCLMHIHGWSWHRSKKMLTSDTTDKGIWSVNFTNVVLDTCTRTCAWCTCAFISTLYLYSYLRLLYLKHLWLIY